MTQLPRADELERFFGAWDDRQNPLNRAALLRADAAGTVVEEAERLLDTFGLNAEFVPAVLGGRLERMDQLGQVLRPVFRRDASLGFGYGLNCFFATASVWVGGTKEQQAKAARILLDGGRIAVLRHEVAHGNDFLREEFVAEPQPGGGFVLNGSKSVIANSSRARGLVVFARTGGDAGRSHSVLLLDRTELPPDRIRNLGRYETAGMRSTEFGGLEIVDCPVPQSALVGELGEGYELSLRASLFIRGLIPSIVLAGTDTALRTATRFAVRRRDDGRSSLDVQHVRDVLTGAFLDILICDCLALVVTRALHVLPTRMSAYAAAAAYLAPKLASEAMDEMSAVLGKATFAADGEYGMFQKHRRDLPITSLGHAGSAGRQVTILPQLPYFARESWFVSEEAPPGLFRLDGELPPLDFTTPALLGEGDPLAAVLTRGAADPAGTLLPGDEECGASLRTLVGALSGELRELREVFAAIRPSDRKSLVSPHSFGLADRYTLVLAAAACLGVWREQHRGPAAHQDAFLADPAWATAALYRLCRRLGLPLPEKPKAAEERVLAEALGRLHGRRSYDLYGSPLARRAGAA